MSSTAWETEILLMLASRLNCSTTILCCWILDIVLGGSLLSLKGADYNIEEAENLDKTNTKQCMLYVVHRERGRWRWWVGVIPSYLLSQQCCRVLGVSPEKTIRTKIANSDGTKTVGSPSQTIMI